MIVRHWLWSVMLVWLLSGAAAWAAEALDDPGEGEDRCAAGLQVDTFAGPEADDPAMRPWSIKVMVTWAERAGC